MLFCQSDTGVGEKDRRGLGSGQESVSVSPCTSRYPTGEENIVSCRRTKKFSDNSNFWWSVRRKLIKAGVKIKAVSQVSHGLLVLHPSLWTGCPWWGLRPVMSFAGRGIWSVYSETDEITLSWGTVFFQIEKPAKSTLNIFLPIVSYSERIAIGFHLLMGSMKSKIIGWRFFNQWDSLGKHHLSEACVINGMAEMVRVFPQSFSQVDGELWCWDGSLESQVDPSYQCACK